MSSKAEIVTPGFRKLLIWLLLPVALLTGRPMVGCICSDGTYKVSCEKLIGSLIWPQSAGTHKGTCCPTVDSPHCPACHQPAEESEAGASSENDCRCRGIENNLKLTSVTNLNQERETLPAAFDFPEFYHSASQVANSLDCAIRNSLPPPDRVVLFLHLTI